MDKTRTYDLVFQVADTLLTEGVRPTQQNVRERMGRGSLTTINKALNVWWAELGQRMAEPSVPNLPEPLVKNMQQLWRDAVFYARDQLANQAKQQEVDYQQRCAHLQHQQQQWQQERHELEQRLREALAAQEALLSEQRQLQERLHQQESRLISQQGELKTLERELSRQEVLHQRLLELEVQQREQWQHKYELLKQECQRLMAKLPGQG
ncbi:DNA-binding protein [Balneatrix alpica]|uniref:DNA-binding protein n=1 Tax=Balneatrix alpica TaxID=75684 RepID=A0ABV5Z8G8_9GAMM|nr:DNA-binding protein [Balneatrix alpica]